jgi:putative DNA primase/helicase
MLGRRRLVNPPVPVHVEAAYSRALRDLLSVAPQQAAGGAPKPREIKLADDAAVLWQRWRHELEPMLADAGELENFRGWGGKLAGFTLRLAGLIELMAGGPQSSLVTGDSMTRAVTMARLLVPHAQAAAGMMTQSPTEALADRVLKKALDLGSPRVQKHELHRALRGGYKNVRALDDALQLLEERGLLRGCDVQTTAGKRSTRMYDINPKLLDPSPAPAAV